MHTLVVSDIHLADAEPPHPRNPLWKRFKRRAHFVDPQFRKFMEWAAAAVPDPCELVLNGDIFDFDSVMRIPTRKDRPNFKVSWLERLRGLDSEESKSRAKMRIILDDHPEWVASLSEFVKRGNRLVFVIGNHDLELHWPSVREDLVDRLELPPELRANVRFCEWFYVSGGDTLIEHGNQYDGYSLCHNPINPLIRTGRKDVVRIPFGNLAGKYMLNGMGLLNPHANSSYIKDSFREYVVFYFKYVLRTQPFLAWSYLWSAFATLVVSVSEGARQALSDPLTLDGRVRDIAERSQSSPAAVWALRELHAHPAVFNPWKVARELWLDRVILLALIFFVSWEFFAFFHVMASASGWWMLLPIVALAPFFVFYSRRVVSDVAAADRAAFEAAPLAAMIAGVRRVVQGHTHLERHTWRHGVEYLNTGTWSYAYRDVECTQPYGRRCFAWIKPGADPAAGRVATLHEWDHGEAREIAATREG